MLSRKSRNMDPFEIQNRFSTSQQFYQPQEVSFKVEDYEKFMKYYDGFIKRLPQREQDLIEMYFHSRKKQKEIAEFFGVTQGAISHRLTRAHQRLKYLRDMPKMTQDLREVLKNHFTSFDIDVIETMIETTCQSKTADVLNKRHKLRGDKQMTQVKIRHRFERARMKLAQLIQDFPDLESIYKLAEYVSKNLYMMHEVILPHFNRGRRAKYKQIV